MTNASKNFQALVDPINGELCATVAELKAWLDQFDENETVEIWRRGYEAELVVTVGTQEWSVDDFSI